MLASAALAPIGSSESRPLLYRRFFTAAECQALDAFAPETALSEINLIRILLSRCIAASRGLPKRGAAGLVKRLLLLTAFSHAALIIASLSRFQEKYFGWGSQEDPVLAALAEMDPNDL